MLAWVVKFGEVAKENKKGLKKGGGAQNMSLQKI